MQTGIAEPATLHCLRCGYDLRGLPSTGACPECGLSVERSQVGERELHRGRPAWLQRLWIGIVLLLGAPVAAGVFLFLRLLNVPMAEWELMAVPIIAATLHAAGLFLLTSVEIRWAHFGSCWESVSVFSSS
jgi:hypothetical protein